MFAPDEELLAELGYKQELHRSWSGFSNFAISFSIISILAGCFTTFASGWNGGGPAAIAWGWPILAALILCIGLCLAELVSAYPTSGGIYWWASKLGGAKAGYYTGWLNLIGLLAIVASVAYGCATFLDLTLGFFSTSYHSGSLNTIFLYFIGILVVAAVVNIFSSHLLAVVNNVSVWWHVFGAAAIVLILIFLPHHHASVSSVFTSHGQQHRLLRREDQRVRVPLRRPAHRRPAHPVHDHRLRRLGPPLRGDQEAADTRGQGHVAVDLLLGHRRVDPAPGLPLRRPERGQGDRRRRWGRHIFAQALTLEVGWHRPADLHRGQFFCTMACMTSCYPHALRLQP